MNPHSNDKPKDYWAFISYSSKDRKWGEWLHRRLENYPIPPEFRGLEVFDGAVLGKNLRPVFRDRDELASSADLGAAIGKALDASRFLVVLCSKNAAKSQWVNKEIEDFQALGKGGRILALILDGEPNATNKGFPNDECFPPALRYPAEPIAGDLRKEGDGKERGFLKVLAGIAQLDFDKLYRRHERAMARKRLVAGITAVFLLSVFAGLSFYAWQQKAAAEEQRDTAVKRKNEVIHVVRKLNTDMREVLTKYAPIKEREKISEMVDGLLRTVREEDLSSNERRERASNLMNKVDVLSNSCNLDTPEAIPLLMEEACRLLEERARSQPDDTAVQRDLSVGYEKFGDLQLRLGQTDAAQRYYEKVLAIRNKLVDIDGSNVQFLRDLTVNFNKLGDLQLRLGQTETARHYYEQALAVAQKLTELDGENGQFQSDAATCCERCGDLQLCLGHTDAAQRYYEHALAVREKLGKLDGSNMQVQSELSVSYEKFGDLQLRLGQTSAAQRYYEQALAVREKLGKLDGSNMQVQFSLSVIYEKCGDLQLRLGHTDASRDYYEQALDVREKLVKSDGANPQFQRSVASSFDRLGRLQLSLGQTDAAQRYYEQALALAKKLADLDGSDVQFQRDVSVSCDRLGDLQLSLGQTEAAQWYYNQASAVTQKLIDIDGANTQFQRDLAVNLNKLGNLQLRLGQADKAQRYYELALATREKLASLDVSNTQYQRDVAGSHAKLGEMYISQGGWSFACQHLMAVVDTLKSMQTAGTLMPNEQKHPLADHLAKLAWCQQLNNQFSESLKSAEESVAIVPVTGPCAAAMKLAHACLFNDRYEEATAIYQKYSGLDFEDGRKWNDELRSDFKTLRAAGQDHPEMKKIEAMLDEQAKPR